MAAPDLITPMLRVVLADAVALLEPTPARVLVAPGTFAAFDDCCDGQVWTRLASVTPVYPANGVAGCAALYRLVEVEVGVVRCAATLDSQGRAPAADAVTADAAQAALDLAALEQALTCSIYAFTDLTWAPLGVEGGCHGGQWTATVKVDACGCQS